MTISELFTDPAVLHGERNTSESGSTLAEVMQNIRHCPYEVTALFDACGNKICEHTNHDDTNTWFTVPEIWAPAVTLMVHNHPSDVSFSNLDLYCGIQINLKVNIIVSPSCNFFLFCPSCGWPTANDWVEEYEDIVKFMRHHPRHDYDRAAARHLALLKVAKHYGLNYRVEDLSGQNITESIC